MEAAAVLQIIARLQKAGVSCWIDGGWGVDALLGRQTRAHADLDLVISTDQLAQARAALLALRFSLSEDDLPARCVLAAGTERIDIHPVSFAAGNGDGVQTLRDGSTFVYPASGFRGEGRILTRSVPCLDAAVQLLCHTGYELDADDLHDIQLLRERFGDLLTLPGSQSGADR